MRKYFHGFSLIELMIVVAIIGILSIIAIPSYQEYTKRARFAEVITATQPFKLAISLALQTGANASELKSGVPGIPPTPKATKNLASITVKNGIITAIGSNIVENKTYILKPDADGSHWIVDGTCVKTGFCESSS
jgi:type IV pilus assembly protein PilA